MALLVCCPCGHPLDCDHLEVVVTLTCPHCERELELELEDARQQRSFAVLTVMEGPYWVGERFVMPIGQELILGTATGNWLSMESEMIAKRHCRIVLSPNGRVDIDDLASESGTWINASRIAKGRLKPTESFRVGEYRFRLDYQASIGGESVSEEADLTDESGRLPVMETVVHDKSLGDRLVRNRFVTSRWMLLIFAWSIAAYHTCALATQAEPDRWTWYGALIAGAVILIVLISSAHRVTLSYPLLRFVSLGVLATLSIVDFAWVRPLPAVCALLLGSAISLTMVRIPSAAQALIGCILGCGATGVMAIWAAVIVLRTLGG
ncbi:MAG: FHA domain-containing protein [Phycisphaerae bacterium]